MAPAAGMGGRSSRRVERRRPGAQSGPMAGRKDYIWPELGWNYHQPRSQDWAEGPGTTLSPDAGREGFCVWLPLRTQRLGLALEWSSGS